MSEHTAPKLNKVPFLVGDALLLGVAAWLVFRSGPPLDLVHNALIAASVALGAWLGAMPFLAEFNAAVKLAEASGLASAVEQVQHLQTVGDQVTAATARWQAVQESADKTAKAAKEIADQIAGEARNFTEFMKNAQGTEVRHLQLEVEKLHRAEGDWLQVVVRMMDHVYALYSAATRAGQPELIQQLGHFQNACRDAARRVGLMVFEVPPQTPFDEKIHQSAEETAVVSGSLVTQTLATGFTYQGQLVRRAMVALQSPSIAASKDGTQSLLEPASAAMPD